MNSFISKLVIIPLKKQVVKIKKMRLTLTLMVMETTLAQDCKNSNSILVHCMLIILSCSSEIYFFVFMFMVFRSDISMKMQYVLLQKHVFFSPVAVRLIKHRPVPGRASSGTRTGIGRFVKRFSWRLSDIVRCPAGHRTVPGRAPLESYDKYFKQKSSGARPMCANAGRAPSGHRKVPGRCHFTLNDPTKRRTGAVEF